MTVTLPPRPVSQPLSAQIAARAARPETACTPGPGRSRAGGCGRSGTPGNGGQVVETTEGAGGIQPRSGHRGLSTWAGAIVWRARILSMTNTLTAKLRTNQGTVQVRLFPDQAPKTVQNFVELAEGSREWTDPETRQRTEARLYDGTIFHRVIPRFMIQGGDPLGTGTGGPGYKFADEIHPDLRFDRPYLLAMANAGPGTNGSQFFITVVPTPHLNGKHTIFGEVVDGREVVDRISQTQTDRNDRPVQDVVLESVSIEQESTG